MYVLILFSRREAPWPGLAAQAWAESSTFIHLPPQSCSETHYSLKSRPEKVSLPVTHAETSEHSGNSKAIQPQLPSREGEGLQGHLASQWAGGASPHCLPSLGPRTMQPPLFTSLQPPLYSLLPLPTASSSDTPSTFLPPDLCTCYFLC